MVGRHLSKWFSSSNPSPSSTWPRLHAVVQVTVMMIISRMLFLLLSVIYSTLLNSGETQEFFSPPNVLPSVFPVNQTQVLDIADGSTATLARAVSHVDVAVVMMYAPWCSNSLATAVPFMETAKTFHNETNVRFIGINCWDGKCRRTEGANIFPRIVVYHNHLSNRVEYSGGRSQRELEEYVRQLLYPMIHITSSDELEEMIAFHECIIIGYFDFSVKLDPPGFINYYFASIISTHTDPLSGLRISPHYAVISNKSLAESLSLTPAPSLHWYSLSLNKGLKYTGPLFSDKIHQWANSFDKLVKRLVPAGNMTHLTKGPVALLFIEETTPSYKYILSNYNLAAVTLSSISSSCKSLSHLFPWQCLSPLVTDRLTSLPLCSSLPGGSGLCPVFNPLFPDCHYPPSFSSSLHCQDANEMGVVYGGWPPPCQLVSLQFYVIDSIRYNTLAENMGVVNRLDKPTLFISDFKKSMIFKFDIDNHTTSSGYLAMIESVMKGQAPLVYRSGRGRDDDECDTPTLANCISEFSTDDFFNRILLNKDNVYIVVHYASGCIVCSQLWPHLYSLKQLLANYTFVKIIRINGERNDLPQCHAPSHYPSVALYQMGRKSFPIWYPLDCPINIDNLLEFITAHTNELITVNEEAEPSNVNEAWEEMGWLLWETAEKEKQLLEQTNMDLSSQIKLLRHRIIEMEAKLPKKRTSESNMASLLSQVDFLMDQLIDTGVIRTDKSEVKGTGYR